MKRLVPSAIFLLALVCAANASDIYNNLGSLTADSDGVCVTPTGPLKCIGPLANSFSTGPGNFHLSMVGVLLDGDPSNTGGRISVDLLKDNMTAPGSLLLRLGTVSDTSLSSTFVPVFFSSKFTLAPNTRYWIELSDLAPNGIQSSANWAWSHDQTALGVSGEFFFNQRGVFDDSFGPYQMEVAVLPGAANPEPNTLLMLGSGVLGLAGLIRRKLTT